MSLVRLLAEVRSDLALHLEVAHFDHRIRPGSGEDALFTVRLCESLGIECHIGYPDLPPVPTQAGLRMARYRWLQRLQRDRRADRIALGHQADDQAETVLFHLMRGTGLRGLAGMPARRGPFVRPLLGLRRRDLQAYLEGAGVEWVVDPSNADSRWTRARLRAEVMPALEARAPGTVERLLLVSRSAGKAELLLENLADRLIDTTLLSRAEDGRLILRRGALQPLGPELLSAVVRRVARSHGVSLTSGGTRAAVVFITEGRSGGRVDIGGGLEVVREYGRIVIGSPVERSESNAVTVTDTPGSGRLSLPGRTVRVRWRAAEAPSTVPGRIAVAVHPTHYPLMFRGWKSGDRIRLPGGSKKLKKLFSDRRVPVSDRGRLPLLADEEGNVLWVDGLVAVGMPRESGSRPSFLEFEINDE